MKMKVLWFCNTSSGADEILKIGDTRGGWIRSLEKSIRDKVRLSVAFYYARYTDPFEHNDVTYYPICNKNWRLNSVKKSLFGDFIDIQDLQLYLDIINKVAPDIIHIHGTENSFGCIVEETSTPLVLSIQGNCTVYAHKYFNGIEEKYSSVRALVINSPYSWIFNKSYKQLYKSQFLPQAKREQKYLPKFAYTIGRTEWDKRLTRILSPRSIYFHCDEILRDSFYVTKWTKPQNKSIIIHSTMGNAFFKGFETVCQTIFELNNIGFNIEWRVAGISDHSLIKKIVKNKLKKLYPVKGLILLGDLSERELITKMLEADIYVMPSHIENSPNSLCEAMIIGMPCISTLAGGTSSLLKDKEEGLVIQDGDPWSMAGSILEMVNNNSQATEYGNNARRKALIRHNPEKIVDDLLNIYSSVISSY